MRIMVTGSCGFQGSHLVDMLTQKRYIVHGVAIPSETSYNNYLRYLSDNKYYTQMWGSINDKDLVERAAGLDIDLVFHLAAKINVDESLYDFENFYKTNIIGTSNILEACRKNDLPLIHISTCEVMGENLTGLPMAEDRPLLPHSPYAASKCGAERMCYAYYKTHGLDVKIVRPFNLYGERQKHHGAGAAIPIMFERVLNDQDIVINGSGEQERDYLHVSDIVRAYNLIMNTPDFKGKVVHVGSGIPLSMKWIANRIIEIVGKGNIVHGPERKGEVKTFTADTSFIGKYGFKPQIGINEGLQRYYKWRIKD